MADLTPPEALKAAIDAAGTQVEFARICGVKQPSVSLWVKNAKALPPELVLKVEAATGISRHLLRPDIYPVEVRAALPAWTGVDRGTDRVAFNRDGTLQGRAA